MRPWRGDLLAGAGRGVVGNASLNALVVGRGTKLVLAADAGGEWGISVRLFGGPGPQATDAAGTVVAALKRGRIEYGGRVVEVTTPHQGLMERRPPFVIVENGREIARVAPKVWDEKPLDVTVLDEEFLARDPLLFLFALYGANGIAGARPAAAAAGSVT